MESWKKKTLIIGGIAGLLTGLLAAYILVQRADTANTTPQITAGDGVKVGLGVLGLLRMVSDFADRS